MLITLPEITIVGDPNSVPVIIADWFAEGFVVGWRDPGTKLEAPAPLNEEALAAFFDGVTSGANARRNIENSEPDPGLGVETMLGDCNSNIGQL